jgi:hypothetical protein
MSSLPLPSEDLPHSNAAYSDYQWRWQLDESISKLFYDACSNELQSLLAQCKWYTINHAGVLTLVINSPNVTIHENVVNATAAFNRLLERFSQHTNVRVCLPPELETPVNV